MRQLLFFIFFAGYLYLYSPMFAHLQTGWETTKKGGVGFRVGGNQELAKYVQYDSLFKAKSSDPDSNYHFGFAMWLAGSEFESQAYIDGISSLQAQGHDLFDLTPNNRIEL